MMRNIGFKLFGPLLASATALVAAPSYAARAHATAEGFGEQVGNDDVYASLRVDSTESATESNVFNHRRRSVDSQSIFRTSAKLFGTTVTPLLVTSVANAETDRYLPTGVDTLTRTTTGNVILNGTILFSRNGVVSGTSSTLSGNVLLTRTIFSDSATFFVGPIPVSVSGSLRASIHGGLNASATGAPYLGRAGTILGSSSASLDSGILLSARFGVGVTLGIADLFVNSSIGIIESDLTPQARNRFVISDSSFAGNWSNTGPVTLTTMNGSVDVSGQVAGVRYSTEIVSWSGYTMPFTTLWQNEGSI